MKKSLSLFLVLVISFFLVDRVVYFFIQSIEKQVFTGQTVGKVNQFLSIKDSVNVLVFGSSRANHHINTKLIDSLSFNMGVDGTRLGYSASLISTLKKKEQVVLVHIDPNILFDVNYKGKDVLSLINWASRYESIEENINKLYPQDVNISSLVKCYAYNGKVLGIVKNYFKPSYDVSSYYGYDPIFPTTEQKEIFKKVLSKTKKEDIYLEKKTNLVNPLMDNFVKAIKATCNANNSKLLFFTSPTCRILSEDLKNETIAYFRSNNIEYFDSSSYISAENLDYWKDLTHLSQKGATKFSKRLAIYVKSMVLN